MYLTKQQKEARSRIITIDKRNNVKRSLQRCPENKIRFPFTEVEKREGTNILGINVPAKRGTAEQNEPWTKEKKSRLLKLVRTYGTKWDTIAPFFPGSSGQYLKNKYFSARRHSGDIGEDIIKIHPFKDIIKNPFHINEDIFKDLVHLHNITKNSVHIDEDIIDDNHSENYLTCSPEYIYEDSQLIQLARDPFKQSPKKTFNTSNHGEFIDVSYTTDSKGGIDFSNPDKGYSRWENPIESSKVDLSEKPVNPKLSPNIDWKEYGMLQNGHFVKIREASRAQHFNIANRLIGKSGDRSPQSKTWHHLEHYPFMVLVDRKVHAKYGHNGGFLLWNENRV